MTDYQCIRSLDLSEIRNLPARESGGGLRVVLPMRICGEDRPDVQQRVPMIFLHQPSGFFLPFRGTHPLDAGSSALGFGLHARLSHVKCGFLIVPIRELWLWAPMRFPVEALGSRYAIAISILHHTTFTCSPEHRIHRRYHSDSFPTRPN